MVTATAAMARGDHGHRVTATSSDEVGQLARAFNDMAAELAEVDRVRREQSERFLAVLSERDRKTLDRILRILVDQ